MTQDLHQSNPQGNNSGEHSADHGPVLSFEHIASVQTATFQVPWNHTLQQAWDTAYIKLGEAHRPGDRLQTEEGIDATPWLTKTMQQLYPQGQEHGHGHGHGHAHPLSRHFQIIGPTGGAQS